MQKLNPDVSSWKKIVRTAQCLEVSKKGRTNTRKTQSAEKTGNTPSAYNSSKSGGHNRNGNNRPPPTQNSGNNYPNKGHSLDVKHSHSNGNHGHSNGQGAQFSASEKQEFRPPKSNLSDKEWNELLAAGKCFKCKEPGHLS